MGRSWRVAPRSRAVTLWSASTGVELAKLENYLDSVSPVIFSSDGKQLAAASRDQRKLQVHVWQIERSPLTGLDL